MKYKKFGCESWEISNLGFGSIRLPTLGSSTRRLDEKEVNRIVHCAIDGGINYFDTAYTYHFGMNEIAIGKALGSGKRQKIKLSTKVLSSIVRSQKDLDTIFNKQLKRLQTDYVDFYLFQALNRVNWEKLLKCDPLEWAEKKIRDGRIGKIGFSFHDEYNVFKDIINYYDKWGLCYLQYNYMDENNQAGRKGLELAAEKAVPVIVMSPLRGGQLSKVVTPEINQKWKLITGEKSVVDLCLQWIWDHKEVTSLLTGASCLKDMEQNLKAADKGFVGCLSEYEKEIISSIKELLVNQVKIPCTGCYYCMPCPNNVFIPGIIETFNEFYLYKDKKRAHNEYNDMIPLKHRAVQCTGCGVCESKCPQNIGIIKKLKEVHNVLTNLYEER